MLTINQIQDIYGKFSYTEGKDGFIIPDKTWVKLNIVHLTDVPIIYRIDCHVKLANDIYRIFNELEPYQQSDSIIDVKDWLSGQGGGCYVPRHTLFKVDKPLSTHSWGCAIDLNVKTNPYGKKGNMPDIIVKTFMDHNWDWGGFWKTPDSMHFQVNY